jgi:hypothetical protein
MLNQVRQALALLLAITVPLGADARTPDAISLHPTLHESPWASPLKSPLESPTWVEAIWRTQNLHLNYQSFTSRFSCQALERRVSEILHTVGAHAKLAADSGCAGAHLTTSARLRIAVASPVSATQENVARATAYDARARLSARVRGISLPEAADLERFPAQWERIALTSQRTARITSADCDLLSALNEQVFPHLAVRLDQHSSSCESAASRVRPRVIVTAMRAVPATATAHLTRDF